MLQLKKVGSNSTNEKSFKDFVLKVRSSNLSLKYVECEEYNFMFKQK